MAAVETLSSSRLDEFWHIRKPTLYAFISRNWWVSNWQIYWECKLYPLFNQEVTEHAKGKRFCWRIQAARS